MCVSFIPDYVITDSSLDRYIRVQSGSPSHYYKIKTLTEYTVDIWSVVVTILTCDIVSNLRS